MQWLKVGVLVSAMVLLIWVYNLIHGSQEYLYILILGAGIMGVNLSVDGLRYLKERKYTGATTYWDKPNEEVTLLIDVYSDLRELGLYRKRTQLVEGSLRDLMLKKLIEMDREGYGNSVKTSDTEVKQEAVRLSIEEWHTSAMVWFISEYKVEDFSTDLYKAEPGLRKIKAILDASKSEGIALSDETMYSIEDLISPLLDKLHFEKRRFEGEKDELEQETELVVNARFQKEIKHEMGLQGLRKLE